MGRFPFCDRPRVTVTHPDWPRVIARVVARNFDPKLFPPQRLRQRPPRGQLPGPKVPRRRYRPALTSPDSAAGGSPSSGGPCSHYRLFTALFLDGATQLSRDRERMPPVRLGGSTEGVMMTLTRNSPARGTATRPGPCGARRVVMAIDPGQDDPELLRTVVMLPRAVAIAASKRTGATEMATAEGKISEALAQLAAKIDGVKKQVTSGFACRVVAEEGVRPSRQARSTTRRSARGRQQRPALRRSAHQSGAAGIRSPFA